jgi:hypothetical protein
MTMITTRHALSNAKLVVSKSTEFVLGLKNKRLLNTIVKQHGNITIHGGMIKTVPWFFAIANDRMQRVLVMVTYATKFVPIIKVGYPKFVKINGISTIPSENGPLYNMVHTKFVAISEGNNLSGLKTIPISSSTRKYVVAKPDVEILIHLTTLIPFPSVVTTKLILLDLGGDPSKPLRGATITFMQLLIPYSRPFRKPLNYIEYNKDYDFDVHVQIFKVTIKINGER